MCVKKLNHSARSSTRTSIRPRVPRNERRNDISNNQSERKRKTQTYRQPLITRPIFVFYAFRNEERACHKTRETLSFAPKKSRRTLRTFQNHSNVIFSLDFFPLVRVFLNASKTGREALCVVRDERRQRIRSERDSQRDGLLR